MPQQHQRQPPGEPCFISWNLNNIIVIPVLHRHRQHSTNNHISNMQSHDQPITIIITTVTILLIIISIIIICLSIVILATVATLMIVVLLFRFLLIVILRTIVIAFVYHVR